MEQIVDPQGSLVPGTVFTAIVARQLPSQTFVQFEVDEDEEILHVLVNGQEVFFGDLMKLELAGVTLQNKGNNTILALFSSGAYVEISMDSGFIGMMLVGLPESMLRTTSGLMGSFNRIISDDLLPRFGTKAIQLDDTLENIHKFGMTCK